MYCRYAFQDVQHIFFSWNSSLNSLRFENEFEVWKRVRGLKTSAFHLYDTVYEILEALSHTHFSRRRQVGIAFRTGSSENVWHAEAKMKKHRNIMNGYIYMYMSKAGSKQTKRRNGAAVRFLPLGGIIRKWRV